MAGHSKWAKIKRSKGAADAKRASTFGKLSSKITIAVKTGGGADPDFNFKLKTAIQAAKEAGMPADTMKRAIDKGESKDEDLKETTYEGYMPGGVAAMVMTASDNTNRTYQNVRNAFTKGNGSIGSPGCVAYMFSSRGEIYLKKPEKFSEDELLNFAMEAGADDIDCSDDEQALVICDTAKLEEVSKALEKELKGTDYKLLETKEAMVPANTVSVTSQDDVKDILKTLNLLEDDDDVIDVIANFDIEDNLINQLNEN